MSGVRATRFRWLSMLWTGSGRWAAAGSRQGRRVPATRVASRRCGCVATNGVASRREARPGWAPRPEAWAGPSGSWACGVSTTTSSAECPPSRSPAWWPSGSWAPSVSLASWAASTSDMLVPRQSRSDPACVHGAAWWLCSSGPCHEYPWFRVARVALSGSWAPRGVGSDSTASDPSAPVRVASRSATSMGRPRAAFPQAASAACGSCGETGSTTGAAGGQSARGRGRGCPAAVGD